MLSPLADHGQRPVPIAIPHERPHIKVPRRPSLSTARLVLRPFVEEDAAPLARAIFAEPDVVKTLVGDASTPRGQQAMARLWIRGWRSTWDTEGYGVWAVCLKQQDAGLINDPIGFCGFSANRDGEPEIVYGLNPRHWGKGIATEAATAAMTYLFRATDAQGAQALILARINPTSVRVAQKLAMRKSGQSPLAEYMDQRACEANLEYDLHRLSTDSRMATSPFLDDTCYRIGALSAGAAVGCAVAKRKAVSAIRRNPVQASFTSAQLEDRVSSFVNLGVLEPWWTIFRTTRDTFRTHQLQPAA